MAEVDPAAAERLAAALRFRTVSYENHADIAESEFAGLGAYLEQAFPRVHAELDVQLIGHSRLYRWAGREDDGQAAAILIAHLDVVPVDDLDGWTHPPFDGVLADGYVWGRGAIDDKARVLSLLEAVEAALAAGERPRRTVYLAFGHDEEIGGLQGAAKIATQLAEQGVRADFLLDEGGVITTGLIDGVRVPAASIMAGEKGFATVRLSTTDLGGHASMPPRTTAVGRLARAVAAVQDNPLPLRVTPPVLDMMLRLAPHMRGLRRALVTRAGRLGPAIARAMAARPETAALVRTTTAPTVFNGGVKANVLPQRAEALVNFRILHGDTIDGVLEHCRKVIRDKQVQVELAPGMRAEPSPLSSTHSATFELLASVAAEVFPGVAITTGLVPGATDARHYHDVVDQRFNFAPVLLTSADLSRIHGTDERLSLENLARLVDFNRRLLARL
jgi:carboxypeptidase PM20D1